MHNKITKSLYVNYSSILWISFLEKTITIEAEKSTIKAVMISDIKITFQE